MATHPRRARLIGLSHMTFQARDVEKSLSYYRGVHGYENQFRLTGADTTVSRAFVGINDTQWIELRPESAPRTDRLLQFGLQVDDAEGMRLYLASRGALVPPATVMDATGNRLFGVQDPDGHRVEFVQTMPGSWPGRSAGKASGGAGALSPALLHIGFVVSSMEKAMAFYRDTLECAEFWRGSSDEKTLSWVHLRLPEARTYVEFMLYDEPPTLERLGVLNHFGLEVPSVPAAMEAASRRAQAAMDFPRRVEYSIGRCRHRLSNVFDPDGTRAEFMETGTFDGSITPSSPAPAPR